MFPTVPLLQQIGLVSLALAVIAWVAALTTILRRAARVPQPPERGSRRLLNTVPRQVVPPSESVELTAAERETFAKLVRQLGSGR